MSSKRRQHHDQKPRDEARQAPTEVERNEPVETIEARDDAPVAEIERDEPVSKDPVEANEAPAETPTEVPSEVKEEVLKLVDEVQELVDEVSETPVPEQTGAPEAPQTGGDGEKDAEGDEKELVAQEGTIVETEVDGKKVDVFIPARGGTFRAASIEVMKAHPTEDMEKVLPLIQSVVGGSLGRARSFYVWNVKNNRAPGKLPAPRAAIVQTPATAPAREEQKVA